MIIVSQDKKKIINFSKVVEINVNYAKSTSIIAWSELNEDDQTFIDLGNYKTEERAKEILEDIVNTRAIFEIYKCSDADTQYIFDKKMSKENVVFDTYKMPES